MRKQILSTSNSLIKQIVLLQTKSRERRKTGLFIIEGLRELNIAIEANYEITSVLVVPEVCDEASISHFDEAISIIEISKEVYKKLAYRDSTEGVIAIAKSKPHDLNQLKFKTKNPLILIAEAPEKPGNIGALLRTADAANVDAFIIANPKTDIYNSNCIRSSVGTVFSNTVAEGTTDQIIEFLKEKNISIYCAILQEAVSYTSVNFTESSAIVVGTEAVGLTQPWRDVATQNIIIPMQGKIDSMNVSVAAGILVFEAVRQRQNN